MKTLRLSTLVLALSALCLSSLSFAAAPQPRDRALIDAGWKFTRGDFGLKLAGTPVTDWRWKAEPAGEDSIPAMSVENIDTSGPGWADAKTGQDFFAGNKSFVWVRTILPVMKGPAPILHFESLDDDGWVFLNGKHLVDHMGWNEPFDVPLAEAWRPAGPNVLAVLIGNSGGGPGGIMGPCLLQSGEEVVAPRDHPANPAYEDRTWQSVDLPHDYVVEGAFDQKSDRNHGYLPDMVGWYRKSFTLAPSDRGKTIWLEFDGIYRNSTLWLNGHLLGRHISGYTSFHYDVTPYANFGGRNLLAVRVDPTSNEGWWYEGGGIYRHVYLTKLAPVHIAHWGTFVTSAIRDVHDGQASSAAIWVDTDIANDSTSRSTPVLVFEVSDPSGKQVARVEWDLHDAPPPHPVAITGGTGFGAVPAGSHREVGTDIPIPKPALWSPDHPNLYRLRTEVFANGKPVDATDTTFGLRTLRYDADKGFFLNGQPLKLQGTCNHQDFGGVGIALPDSLHDYRIRKLKGIGSNAYRCSHNPPAEELLDACDRLGMVVMDENRHLGSSPDVLDQVASMVERDRNHPSIIMWSMCNEEGAQGTPQGQKMFSAMMDVVHRYDKTRPISCAMNGGWGSGITNVEDLQGFNYSPNQYDGFHASHPKMPIFGSETASHVSDRGEYTEDKPHGYCDVHWGYPEGSWKPVAERDFVAGSFVWTGFDYRGEPSPYDWPCISSHFGIIDTCGFWKDAAWYYKAWWGDKPVVHAFPNWTLPGREGQEIEVWCYGNTEQVELFVNGQSVGVQNMPRWQHVAWRVKYEPGVLEVRGLNGGKVVATEKTETTTAPVSLQATPDRTSILSDNEDIVPVAVAILDDHGRPCPNASDEVSFTVEGPAKIAGVGNGDASSHEPDKASKRHAYHGYCMVFVQSTFKPGQIRLTATAPNLKPATVTLKSAKP